MSEQPTPETDAAERMAYAQEYMVPTDFARKLERERDEAREDLNNIRINLGEDADGFTLLHAVCALQNERDEARELAQQMSDSNQVLLADVRFYRNAWEQLKEAGK